MSRRYLKVEMIEVTLAIGSLVASGPGTCHIMEYDWLNGQTLIRRNPWRYSHLEHAARA